MQKFEEKASEMAMKWYGWGSPVGLGILLVSIATALVLLSIFLNNLALTGRVGMEIREQGIRLEQGR